MVKDDCPCDRNCSSRSVAFCPICEKGKEYKKRKFKEYEQNTKLNILKSYTFDSINKEMKKRKNFLKGRIK